MSGTRACRPKRIFFKMTTSKKDTIKKSMADYSWSEIAEILNSGNASEYFAVGDEKPDELYTGEKISVRLISLEPHDLIVGGENKARAAFMFFMDGEYEMNEKPTNNGGWRESKMRNVYMWRFFKLLPSDLQAVIRSVVKQTHMDGELRCSEDKLFLLSEAEIIGKTQFSSKGEGKRYEWFKKNKLPNKWFWLRSPSPAYATTFASWNFNGYVPNSNSASYTYLVAPCFCI